MGYFILYFYIKLYLKFLFKKFIFLFKKIKSYIEKIFLFFKIVFQINLK
jgi:hypothetical protein